MINDRSTWLSLFDFSPISIAGRSYELSQDMLEYLSVKSDYWHSAGDPSSWLTVSLFRKIRSRFPDLTERQQLEFTAHALGVPFNKVVSGIKWHDGYMTFKDGDPQETLEGKY